MKKYIIVPFVLSIIGHSLFFGVFKTDIKSKLSRSNSQLFLISKEQFDYIRGVAGMAKVNIISPFPNSLSMKNNIWKDALDIVRDGEIMNLDVLVQKDDELLEDSKSYNFKEIAIPLGYHSDITWGVHEESIPVFGDLLGLGLIPKMESQDSGYTIKLSNDLNMRYYIQGPILSRRLISSDTQGLNFNIDKHSIKAKLRFWITKDGSVNQVIVEESSSFPLVDSEIVNLIKKWRFSPVYAPSSPLYEWGVIIVRLQR